MEANWIEALRNTPLPNTGSLTDRALAQVKPRPRYVGKTLLVGSLTLAATLPLAAFFLKVPTKKSDVTIFQSNLTHVESDTKSFQSDVKHGESGMKRVKSKARVKEPTQVAVEPNVITPLDKRVSLGKALSSADLSPLGAFVEQPQHHLSLNRGLSAAFAFNESRALSPLPNRREFPGTQANLVRQADGHVEGTLTFVQDTLGRGLIPQKYDADVALYDHLEQLVATTKVELPGDGGTVLVYSAPSIPPTYYQVQLTPKRSWSQELEVVGGYQKIVLDGTTKNLPMITLGTPIFYRSTVGEEVTAKLTTTLTTAEAARYTVHMALYGAQKALLDTATSSVTVPKLVQGKALLTTQDIQLSFRPQSEPLSRYQLAVTKTPQDEGVSFTVASVQTEKDGALILVPKRPDVRIEDALKNPKLRDYTQVKLTASVVAALKEKGITTFVGRRIHAKGKSEEALYLSRPAFQVTTVTVSTPDDLQLAQDYLHRLREAHKVGMSYELLIAPEFNEVLLAAADRGDDATVIELVQISWFGGPESAAKGGNAITWAAYCPSAEPVRRLLARNTPPGVADSEGTTGLHRTYREEIARLLLEKGAPVEARNKDGETPLIQQARQCDLWLGHAGVIQALLEHHANPNATDPQGKTALMHVAQRGMVEVVEALLKAGANPKTKDKSGKTAYDYAAPWAWQMAPGFQTEESLKTLEKKANADAERIRELLRRR